MTLQELIKSPRAVLMLGQTTCDHCKSYRPVFEEVAQESLGGISWGVCYVDVEEGANEIANQWGVGALPSTMILLSGVPVGRLEGEVTAVELRTKIALLLGV